MFYCPDGATHLFPFVTFYSHFYTSHNPTLWRGMSVKSSQPITKEQRLDKKYLTVTELAELMRCSKGTVYRKAKAREWPHKQDVDGGTILFSEEDIAAIQEMGKKPAPPPKRNARSKSARTRALMNGYRPGK